MQEAARNALVAPGPGPLLKGVAPEHNLSGILPIILSNDHGMQVHVLPVGATLQRVIVPNQQGVAEDVVLGFDDPSQYQVRVWHSSLTVLALLHLTKQSTGIKGPAHVLHQLLSSSTALSMKAILQTNNTQYFGGIVGRVANRIANASFNLDGHTYQLGANDRCCLLI